MTSRARVPTIVAIGGGGFLTSDNWAMEEVLVKLTGKDRPKVCFLGQAGSDHPSERSWFYRCFGNLSKPTFTSHLDLCRNRPADISSFLLEQDLIYVGGGDDVAMLAIWRAHGIDAILRECWQAGIILSGMSAGADCWFDDGITDAHGGIKPLGGGLGFLPGFCCPHYDTEPQRKAIFEKMVRDSSSGFGFAADDNAALCFIGTELAACYATKRDAKAYRLERKGEGVVHLELEIEYIGD